EIKQGKIAKATLDGNLEEAERIAKLDLDALRQEINDNPEDIDELREVYFELQNLPEAQKEGLLQAVQDIDNIIETAKANNESVVELTSASNPKAEIEEAESYNNVTSEVVNDLAQKDGKLETRDTDIHPKIVMPLNNKAFVDWATQGVSHKGKEVEYRLNTGKYADRRAL